MKVLVCGGRDYSNWPRVFDVLNSYVGTVTIVIHGGANGADCFASQWARRSGAQEVICPANWEYYGGKAGPIRNHAMADLMPDLVIAFPGGRGTAGMVKIAEARGIEVRRIDWL